MCATATTRTPGTRSDKVAPLVLLGDFNDGVEADGRLNGSYQRLLDLTGVRNAYGLMRPMNTSSQFLTGNAWSKTARQGRMIDHVLISHPGLVWGADVDRTMFTAAGAAVTCTTVTNGLCPNGMRAADLRLYSDHWASWALIAQ
jgi:hypothetical protein